MLTNYLKNYFLQENLQKCWAIKRIDSFKIKTQGAVVKLVSTSQSVSSVAKTCHLQRLHLFRCSVTSVLLFRIKVLGLRIHPIICQYKVHVSRSHWPRPLTQSPKLDGWPWNWRTGRLTSHSFICSPRQQFSQISHVTSACQLGPFGVRILPAKYKSQEMTYFVT